MAGVVVGYMRWLLGGSNGCWVGGVLSVRAGQLQGGHADSRGGGVIFGWVMAVMVVGYLLGGRASCWMARVLVRWSNWLLSGQCGWWLHG